MHEVIGKYRILDRVGRGGMGLVFKAHDPVLDRIVAIKLVSADLEVSDEIRARFFREAYACAQLSHPNIVTIYDMGEDDGRLYIVMEFLEAVELSRLIRQRDALTVDAMVSIMVQVCDGLHYAHEKGIVHRDVKPANILLLPSGDVKIVDFGIARIAATGGLTRSGVLMGTLRYMAPEQMWGRADERSDIFSIGSVFYELLAGRPPFDGDNPMEIMEQIRAAEPRPLVDLDPAIPPEVAAIVERAMRRDPGERFDNLEQMRLSLEAVQRQRARPEPTAVVNLHDAAAPPRPTLDATLPVGRDLHPTLIVPRRRTVHAGDVGLCVLALGLTWLMVWGPPQPSRLSSQADQDSVARSTVPDVAGRMPGRPDGGGAGAAAPSPTGVVGRNDEYAYNEGTRALDGPPAGSSADPAGTRRGRETAGASRGGAAGSRRVTDRSTRPPASSATDAAAAQGSARAGAEHGPARPTAPRAETPTVDADQVTKQSSRAKQAESDLTGTDRVSGAARPLHPAPPAARTGEPPDAAPPSRPVESSQAPASRGARWRAGQGSTSGGEPRRARRRDPGRAS